MNSRQPQAGLFLNRELSWLEFNSRVLEESRNSKNPLLERLRFYCIFHSNLDEFFMVRVAALRRRIKEEDHAPDPAGFTPYEQLERVLSRVQRSGADELCALQHEASPRPGQGKDKDPPDRGAQPGAAEVPG